MSSRELEAQKLQKDWSENPRWRGIKRGYTAEEVPCLRDPLFAGATRGAENCYVHVNFSVVILRCRGRVTRGESAHHPTSAFCCGPTRGLDVEDVLGQ